MNRIFIESGSKRSNETAFIGGYIKHVCPDAEVDIINVDGKDNLGHVTLKLRENTDNGGGNLVIFDADGEWNDGGFSLTKDRINKTLEGLSYELFLFPNNEDDGDFETLLEKIANPGHKSILECFEKYIACLRTHKYKMPARKAKMYAYIYALNELKKGEWEFDNVDYWDCNHCSLKPLKEFIMKNVKI